jgi:hypothetical protein
MGWVSGKVKASSQKHGLEEIIKYMILCRKSKGNFIKLFIKEGLVHV